MAKDVYSSSQERNLKSYGASPAIWNRIVLTATRHRWTCHTSNPANQASTRFTYAGGMEGWVDRDSWLYTV